MFMFLAEFSVTSAEEFQESSELTPEEKYLDIFPLSKQNFTENVMKTKDPWIILFHEGTLTRAWKKVAVGARGLVWLGMVDRRIEPEFLKELVSYDDFIHILHT